MSDSNDLSNALSVTSGASLDEYYRDVLQRVQTCSRAFVENCRCWPAS
jgi:hypothetical protein